MRPLMQLLKNSVVLCSRSQSCLQLRYFCSPHITATHCCTMDVGSRTNRIKNTIPTWNFVPKSWYKIIRDTFISRYFCHINAEFVFQGDDWQHREWLCQLCGFLLYENIYISIGFLCCISLDRYLAVVHPLRYL